MAQAIESQDLAAKRKRTRSPAYPFIGLETSLERAKQFYDKEQRNAANVAIAIKHWGFVEDSSNGAQTVAALISFGLMQDEGTGDRRAVRLTQDALRILLDMRPDSEERAELIKKCALAPKIHKQLWEKWGNDLPSDAQLRHTLLFDWETPFNENAVDNFIAEYKGTIAYAKVGEPGKIIVTEAGDTGVFEEAANTTSGITTNTQTTYGSRVPLKTHMQEFVVPLSDGTRAIFQWPTSLTLEDVDDLKDSLKILERKISRSVSIKTKEAAQ